MSLLQGAHSIKPMERPISTRRHHHGRDTISEPSTNKRPPNGREMAQDGLEATPVYLTQQHLYVQISASPSAVFQILFLLLTSPLKRIGSFRKRLKVMPVMFVRLPHQLH